MGPKEADREGMLEKKRARREGNRAFREKGDDGYEADESTLLGGASGDSFQHWVFCVFLRDCLTSRVAWPSEMLPENVSEISVL